MNGWSYVSLFGCWGKKPNSHSRVIVDLRTVTGRCRPSVRPSVLGNLSFLPTSRRASNQLTTSSGYRYSWNTCGKEICRDWTKRWRTEPEQGRSRVVVTYSYQIAEAEERRMEPVSLYGTVSIRPHGYGKQRRDCDNLFRSFLPVLFEALYVVKNYSLRDLRICWV